MTIFMGVHDTIGLLGMIFFGGMLVFAGLNGIGRWLGRSPRRGQRNIY